MVVTTITYLIYTIIVCGSILFLCGVGLLITNAYEKYCKKTSNDTLNDVLLVDNV